MSIGKAVSYAATQLGKKGIRLISGGAGQKTTQGMLGGAGKVSKGGVESMGSMGTLPSRFGQIKKTPPAKGVVETPKSIYKKK